MKAKPHWHLIGHLSANSATSVPCPACSEEKPVLSEALIMGQIIGHYYVRQRIKARQAFLRSFTQPQCLPDGAGRASPEACPE